MAFVPRLYDYAPSGNCLKARLALRLAERPFERVPVDIFGGDTLTDEFAAMNPARTVPVMEVSPGRHLSESNAILLHVAEGTPLLPDDPLDRADVHRWLFFEREFTPAVGGVRFLVLTGRDAAIAPLVAFWRATGKRLLRLLDRHLADRSFVAGDAVSVADLSLYAYAHVAPEGGFDLEPWPHLREWLDRVAATPGFENDLEPYPDNAWSGRGSSIYDRS
jgi:glutathione S-transferase